jgi:transcriptional regulator with XRE-family HTH domain
MARIIGVSFSSVNRWEGGHSAPIGSVRDLYAALGAALAAGTPPAAILRAANNERGVFLYTLFKLAYGDKRKAGRA